MAAIQEKSLGDYLRACRCRVDPSALGLPAGRRRTPGLRREEVALRSHISTTWYTWLEQGRGGAPSAQVLDRIARALLLSAPEREHLFLLGLGHPPETRYEAPQAVTPRLQRLLDSFDSSPAIVKTATWNVVAWNRAAACVLTDYGKLPAAERNILRLVFCNPRVREAQDRWHDMARFVVGAFRADAARAGAATEVDTLVAELCACSPAFADLWRDNEVRAHGEGTKRLRHPVLGALDLEYSGFSVDGRPDLGMIVYTPCSSEDAARIRALVQAGR